MSIGQRWAVVVVLVAGVILGVVVEWRSAWLRRRMTDAGCYFRAAWAIRAGADPYDVRDDNTWHYNYPPFLAIVLGPLADPPAGGVPVMATPYPVSVALWYVLSVLALFLAAHLFALAVERGLSRPPRRWGYHWWALRLVPLLVCLPAVGRTLARGQVNTLVLALLAGWVYGAVAGRRVGAGVCLALAMCIKVIPAFLILHPLWRRDGRCLVGVALGLAVGLAGLPALVSSPETALRHARTYLEVTLLPGLGLGTDGSRAHELTNTTATDSQSIQCAIHNLRHPHPWYRPALADRWTRLAHWSIAGLLTVLTLATLGRRPATPHNEVALTGALAVVMALTSPVCHPHYFVFALPLVTALRAGPHRAGRDAVFVVFMIANYASALPLRLPDSPIQPVRDLGVTTAAALALWAIALPKARPGGAVAPDQGQPVRPTTRAA